MHYDNDVCSRTPWPDGQVLVQTATYNEKGNIAALIEAVLTEVPEAQILVIDDQSPDGTGEIVYDMATHNQRVHLLGRRGRRGLGSAILEGLQKAKSRGFEIAVYMDADFSHDPKDIPRLLEAIGQGNEQAFDIAIGSRRVRGGGTVGWPLSRQISSWLVCWFTKWFLRVPVKDSSGGFRAIRLTLLDDVNFEGISKGYAFQEDFLWRAHRAGARIIEVPIVFTDREVGSSKADFAEMKRSIGELLKLARITWMGF